MSAVFLANGYSDQDGSGGAAAAALPCTDQDVARAAETFQEYLTPHNVCMFIIVKEFLLLCQASGGSLDGSQGPSTAGATADGDAASGGPEGLVRTPAEKFELYNFVLDQLDEAEQLFPMEALISRGRAAMKPALCKQVDKRMRQFFIKQQAKEARSPFHTLETYLSYAALNALFRDEGRAGGGGCNGGCPGVGLSPSSVCGAFMRKVVYAFQSRTFAQAYNFVGRLRMYYYGCVDANDTFSCPEEFRRRQSEEQELHTLGLLDANRFRPEDEPDAWQLDRRHAEVFVARQAFLLEQNPAEAMPPRELETRLVRLCRLHPGLECLHFLRYLNAIRRRDRTGAERCLRAYFGLRGDRGAGVGGAYDVTALAAMMHYFGFREEAQMPLREALLHCLLQSDGGSDRARSAAELASVQMKSDVRRLLTGSIPLRGVLTRVLLDRGAGAGPQGKSKLVVAATVQHVLSACHLFGLHSVSCVLAQALLLTDLSERGVPLLNESVAVAAGQLAVQLGEQGASVLAQDMLSSLLWGLAELRSPITQALEAAQTELQFQRALFASDYARATSLAAASASASASDLEALGDGVDEVGSGGGGGSSCSEADSLLKRAVAQLGLGNLHAVRRLCSAALDRLRRTDPPGGGATPRASGTPAAVLAVRARLILCEAALLGQCPSLCYPELAQCQQLAAGCRLFCLAPLLRLYRAAAHHASGRPAEALAELSPGRGHILAQGSVCLRARLLLLEAQAKAALGRLRAAARRLLAARRGFRAVGCVSRERACCLLLAHVYHRMGAAGPRNRAAAAYARLPAVPDPVGVF